MVLPGLDGTHMLFYREQSQNGEESKRIRVAILDLENDQILNGCNAWAKAQLADNFKQTELLPEDSSLARHILSLSEEPEHTIALPRLFYREG